MNIPPGAQDRTEAPAQCHRTRPEHAAASIHLPALFKQSEIQALSPSEPPLLSQITVTDLRKPYAPLITLLKHGRGTNIAHSTNTQAT
jgi:hypothetical protein